MSETEQYFDAEVQLLTSCAAWLCVGGVFLLKTFSGMQQSWTMHGKPDEHFPGQHPQHAGLRQNAVLQLNSDMEHALRSPATVLTISC